MSIASLGTTASNTNVDDATSSDSIAESMASAETDGFSRIGPIGNGLRGATVRQTAKSVLIGTLVLAVLALLVGPTRRRNRPIVLCLQDYPQVIGLVHTTNTNPWRCGGFEEQCRPESGCWTLHENGPPGGAGLPSLR